MKKPRRVFFVGERCESGAAKHEVDTDFALELLVLGKKCGLSLAEMNEFRVRDLLDFVEIYTGAKEKRPRMATQEDIDAFFSM